MSDELMNIVNGALLSLSKAGSKPAKIILLQSDYKKIVHEIIEKYCLKEKLYEEKQDIVINFLKQIISLAKDLQIELDK